MTGSAVHERRVALGVTTVGILAATLNASILLISLPAIFAGLGLDPLAPSNISLLLWMLMGYMLVTAVLVVTLAGSATNTVGPGCSTWASRSSRSPRSSCRWTRSAAAAAPSG